MGFKLESWIMVGSLYFCQMLICHDYVCQKIFQLFLDILEKLNLHDSNSCSKFRTINSVVSTLLVQSPISDTKTALTPCSITDSHLSGICLQILAKSAGQAEMQHAHPWNGFVTYWFQISPKLHTPASVTQGSLSQRPLSTVTGS